MIHESHEATSRVHAAPTFIRSFHGLCLRLSLPVVLLESIPTVCPLSPLPYQSHKPMAEQTHTMQESDSIREQIEDRMGPRTLAILACVSSDDIRARLQTEFGDRLTQRTLIESSPTLYQSRIDALANSGARRLVIIFSTSFQSSLPGHRISIPSTFTHCEITCCNGASALFDETNTYCGIPMPSWNTRENYPNHELLTLPGHNVAFSLPPVRDGSDSRPPFDLDENTDAESVAETISSMVSDSPPNGGATNILPWLAGAAAGGGTTWALLVNNFELGVGGVYLTVEPGVIAVSAGTAGFTATGGAAVAVAGGAGILVAAAVYFIPWSKLGRWMVRRWDRFFYLLKSVRRFLRTSFIRFIMRVLMSVLDEVLSEAREVMSVLGANRMLRIKNDSYIELIRRIV